MAARDVNYFELFIKETQICKRAAEGLCDMLSGKTNFSGSVEVIRNMALKGEKLYNQTYEHLSYSFITPIEKDDIMAVAKSINMVVNSIDKVAIVLDIFATTLIKTEAKEYVNMIAKSCDYLVEAAREFEYFKRSKKLNPIIIRISHIKKNGDTLYQSTLKKLIAMEKDSLEIIKWKDIFDEMKTTLTACENVANTIKEAIIKNS